MKINEIERLLDLSRANIRFYEKEGLIDPKRNENGYRDYSEEDVEKLRKIVVLRKLGFPISEIKEIMSGNANLQEAMRKNSAELKRQIEELKGAYLICQKIIEDEVSVSQFDGKYYYDTILEEEKQGFKFVDIVSDYASFEKTLFVNTIGAYTGEKKPKTVFVIILIACILRGLFFKVIGHDSFFKGFIYPFSIFALLSVSCLPIFFFSKKYKEKEMEDGDGKYLSTPIILLFVVGWLIVMFAGSGVLLEDVIYKKIWAPDIYYVSHNKFSFLYFVASIMVMVMFIFLFRKKGIGGNFYSEDSSGIVCNWPYNIRCITMIAFGVAWIAIWGLNAATYERFDLNGITSRVLFWEKNYSLEDISTYEIDAAYDNTLVFSLLTADGRKYRVIDGGFGTIYELKPDGMEDYDYESYIKDMVRYLHAQGKDSNTNWEKVEDDMMDYWRQYTKDLHEIVKSHN